MNYFMGKELEGKHRGKLTLFIKGSGELDRIIYFLNMYKKIKQLYFGASFQSQIKEWEVIRKSLMFNKVITIEILFKNINKIPIDIINNKKIHKVITFRNIINRNLTLKLENKEGVYCFNRFIFNNYKKYYMDIILE